MSCSTSPTMPRATLWRHQSPLRGRLPRKAGQHVRVPQSHGGSGSQARAWPTAFPPTWFRSRPGPMSIPSDRKSSWRRTGKSASGINRYPTSRRSSSWSQGNPFGIRNWPDLLQDGLKIITPNPKTSGGAKLNLLGAWLYKLNEGRSPAEAREFVTELFRRVPVLDSGARGATMTFARKGIGDVHLTWENKAELEKREMKGALEIIRPPVSIQAEPHVALVDGNTSRKGTTEAARAYLEYLYTPAAQGIIADMFFRPVDWEKDSRFAKIELLRATDPRFPSRRLERDPKALLRRRRGFRSGLPTRAIEIARYIHNVYQQPPDGKPHTSTEKCR